MTEIRLLERVGSFAENKDEARDIRLTKIIPSLDRKEEVVLNFEGVESATQSFIHALIRDLITRYGNEVLDRIYFKNCSTTVRKIINIVTDYTQEAE